MPYCQGSRYKTEGGPRIQPPCFMEPQKQLTACINPATGISRKSLFSQVENFPASARDNTNLGLVSSA
jgi:hypothetical protein